MKNIGFFEEQEGQYSMTRLITFLLVVIGSLIAMAASAAIILKPEFRLESGIQLLSFSMTLIITGITTKLVQKNQEVKENTEWRKIINQPVTGSAQ